MVSIILYGYVARGDNTDESDVDIAIILNNDLTIESKEELSDVIVEMDLKYNRVYSVVDINKDDYDEWKRYIPFYSNVDREGIVLWKAPQN